MREQIRELVNSKDLLLAWTGRTLRARYQQSLLGWLWAIVQPTAQTAVFTVIFTLFVPLQTGDTPYVLFAFVATIPWTFLALSLPDMAGSIVSNMSLVTKIRFPRETLPAALMLARLVDLAVAGALLAAFLLFANSRATVMGCILIPAILGVQILLILGLGLAAAAVNVFYRDVQPILALTIQLWFWASPVVYPVSAVPSYLKPYYFLNPMAGILESYRSVLLNGRLPGSYLFVSALISVAVFAAGYALFRRLDAQFADVV